MRKTRANSRSKNKRTISEELEDFHKNQEYISNDPLHFKLNLKFKSKKQKEMYNTIMDNRITFVNGTSGTGKTIVALFAALECLKRPDINIDQIVLTKPIVEITTQRGIGSLPGDINEKTLAYYTHFYDNLCKIIGNENTRNLKQNGLIKETVLNYLRGSTFGKYTPDGKPIGTFCIFDESQNSSVTEMKTFISRMGEESKLVILGDSDQVDLKLHKGEKNGLDDAISRLGGISGIGIVEFTEEDIVRDPFLIEIMKRYKSDIPK